MASYAALVSLMNLIDQIHHHPQPPITLDKEQTQSLTEKIAFLQDFLEVYNCHYSNQEVERLRSRIADAAYDAEDVIESRIVDQIRARRKKTSSTRDAEKIGWAYLHQGLQKVLEEMDSIKKEVEEIKEKLGTQEQLPRIVPTPVVSSKSPPTQHNTMVGFDDVLNEMLHKLTGQPLDRQIFPISGMGGIGKTTLARNVYTHPLIEHHFYVLAWVTISQEYDTREILLEILLCQNNQESRERLSQMNDSQLGEELYKSLYGRRYLIVMDDMWSTDIWDKVKFFFPNNNEGSRIIVTTRLSNLASCLNSSCGLEMNFLDQDKSWSLFCKTVFDEEDCPPELEHIGMEIVKNCKGLPLSIVVLGRLLAKSKQTQEYWAYILGNLSSIVNLEENERYLNILHTSYEELPVHLKTCFLYMGTFPEDSKIRVSELIGMWVAEGFLKPSRGKSLEESAVEYLIDLIDRNLILVSERGYYEKVVFCNIHDLLRDLCIREAQKEKFFFSANQDGYNTPYEGRNTQRRIVLRQNMPEKEYLHILKSASVARSLICYFQKDLRLAKCRLLRVFKRMDGYLQGKHSFEAISNRVNLRFVAVNCYQNLKFPSSFSLLWNLQTLIIHGEWSVQLELPGIWKMPLLRHVEIHRLRLSDPPSDHTDRRDDFVLHNLHTLLGLSRSKFGEEVVKRIPNVKKLKLWYSDLASDYCLNNLGHLYKLESLDLSLWRLPYFLHIPQSIVFPDSLKELSLTGNWMSSEGISRTIGSLPHLQVLKLTTVFVPGSGWETTEGQFCSLKYLSIRDCGWWKYWTAESTHFPRLEHLVLEGLSELKEIPCGIGDIPTLKSIQLKYSCSYSAIISAKQILEEQEELGNEDLRVTVAIDKWQQEKFQHLENLASRNFQLKFM